MFVSDRPPIVFAGLIGKTARRAFTSTLTVNTANGSFAFLNDQPAFFLARYSKGPEDVCIEHSSAIASVKAFDDTVLSRMSRLDIDDVYVITLAPLLEHL